MHILLTDRLTCPRCGPELGLILLAHHIRDRRVLEGQLGCANCRERFEIGEGVADLRWPPTDRAADVDVEAAEAAASRWTGDPEPVLRLAALLGITGGPGCVLLAGDAWVWARGLASLLGDIEWVTDAPGARVLAEVEGVSRVVATPDRLPFFSGTFRGVVLERSDRPAVAEAARLLGPRGRLVVLASEGDVRSPLEDAGLAILASDGSAIVAARESPGRDVASTSGRG